MAKSPTAIGVPEDLVSVEDYALRDAIVRYNEQVGIVASLRKEWVRLKSPVTSEGGATGKALVVHPLLKEIQDAEMRADRLLVRVLEKRKVGRPSGSKTSPDRQGSVGDRVRRVK